MNEGIFMEWYVDASLIVNVRYLIEAHCVNGNAEFDGFYMISCLLKHAETLKEVGGFYQSREGRDAAFCALGAHIKLMESFLGGES